MEARQTREGDPLAELSAMPPGPPGQDTLAFEASPAHAVPGPVGKAAAKIAGKFTRD